MEYKVADIIYKIPLSSSNEDILFTILFMMDGWMTSDFTSFATFF